MKRPIHIALYAAAILVSAALSRPARAESVCATAKIEIDQKLAFERQAFNAVMNITNNLSGSGIENVAVSLLVTDANGDSVNVTSDPNNFNASFFVKISSMSGISGIAGDGKVASATTATIGWLLIPAVGAGLQSTVGTLYTVGATLTYTINGTQRTVEVAAAPITVLPQPQLTLDYFIPRDVIADNPFTPVVEPTIPFTFGVLVTNNGYGAANGVTIASAQPKIVDNKQGLLVNFLILGSSVADKPTQPTLLLNLGDIAAQKSSIGRWVMTTTLAGKFTAFDVSFTHSDNLGGQLTSLVTGTNPHWLVHDVLVDIPGRDGVRDFLAESGAGFKVWESDNIVDSVTDASAGAAFTQTANNGGSVSYSLVVPTTNGMSYVKIVDPFNGTKNITSMLRGDGKPINLANAWTSQSVDPVDPTKLDYYVNFFDTGVPAGAQPTQTAYTVIMSDPVSGPVGPSFTYIPNRSVAAGKPIDFVVIASDPSGKPPVITAGALPAGAVFADQGNGHAYFDWNTTTLQSGVYPVRFTASLNGLSSSQTATITVARASNASGTSGGGTGSGGAGVTLDTSLTSPAMPTFAFPAWGTLVATLTPTLAVTDSLHAPGRPVTYDFEILSDDSLVSRVAFGGAVVEGSGSTSWTVPTPLSNFHTYVARARAADGSAISRWVYTRFTVALPNGSPTVPVVSWPPDRITVVEAHPILSVTNSTDYYSTSVGYLFSVYSDQALGNLVTASLSVPADPSGVTKWPVDTALESGSTYYWQATAVDGQGYRTSTQPARFTVNTGHTAPPSPVASAPAAGAIVSDSKATLTVAAGAGASGTLSYVFQLDTRPTFDGVGVRSATVTAAAGGGFSSLQTGLSENTLYYWRAMASDGTADSDWTPTQSFATARLVVPPAAPAVKNPGDGAWVQTTTPTLIVAAGTGADALALAYDFEVYADADLTTPVQSGSTAAARAWKPVQALTAGSFYFWRARAKDALGHVGDWMIPARFGVASSFNADPLTLDILSPVASLSLSSGTIPVAWANFNPDSGAALSLYYNSTPTLITDGLETSPAGDSGAYTWNVAGVPAQQHTLSFQLAASSGTVTRDSPATVTVQQYPAFLALCLSGDAAAAPVVAAIRQSVAFSDCRKANNVLSTLVSLDLTGLGVTDLRAVLSLTNLQTLTVDNNPGLTSLGIVSTMVSLTAVSAAGTGVLFDQADCPTNSSSTGVNAWCLANASSGHSTPTATPTATATPTVTPTGTTGPGATDTPAPTPTAANGGQSDPNPTPTPQNGATPVPTGVPATLRITISSGSAAQSLLPGQPMSPVVLSATAGGAISIVSNNCGEVLHLDGTTVSGTVPPAQTRGTCTAKFAATLGAQVSATVSITIQVTSGSGFYRFCASQANPDDMKTTVAALMEASGETGGDCAAADRALLALKTLDLHGAGISRLDPIAGMKNLVTLILGGNAIAELSPLARLRNLRTLVLDRNGTLNNLSALGRLRLKSLSVAGDPIGKNLAHCPFPTMNDALDRFCSHYLDQPK